MISTALMPYGLRSQRLPVGGAQAVVARDLCVGYPGANKAALHEVSITLPVGSRVAIVGPNGAGKSSLLKAIMGLLPIYSGQLEVFGLPVGTCRARLAYLPQRGEIDWTFPVSVERLILTGRYVHLGWLRWPGKKDLDLVHKVAGQLNLLPLLQRQIGQLSGGQQQRALLARALVQQAELILLDEPLNAVDAESREMIRAMLHQLHHDAKTLLVATHEHGWKDGDFDAIVHLREGCVSSQPHNWQGWQPGKGPVCPG